PADWVFLLQALAIPVAFVLTIFSVRMTNNWAREPHPEKALPDGLKSVSKKSILYNYFHFPARHVLIAPQGVYAIVTRWHDDEFTVDGDEWKTHKSSISRFLSGMRMDGVGDPVRDAKRAAQHVSKAIADIAPDVEVQPLVVFVSPKVEITFEGESSVPILFADEKKSPNLNDYMRDLNRAQKDNIQQRVTLPMTDEQIEAFESATLP
ncbi:MAG: nuclease-related domain-containing protein, partial [Chloroflexota bacterium]